MTAVIELAVESASAKVAEGAPEDEAEDYALAVWAGVVPVATTLGEPEDDGRLQAGVELPASVRALVGRRL
jgi:hypothetical protein